MTTLGASRAGNRDIAVVSRNWNVPNAITVVRIVLSPAVFALVLLSSDDIVLRWVATALFVLVIATDGIDGHIARSRGLITDLGKILDPIADKFVTSGVLVCLSILGELPWWVSAIIIIREVGITVWRLFEVQRGNVVPASSGGKLKTIVQSVAISLALAPLPALWSGFDIVNTVVMSLAVLLTVTSGISYVKAAIKLRRDQS